MKKKPITAGPKEGLGAGIFVLGLMLAFMPSMADKISKMDGVTGTPFVILTGSAITLAVFVMLAGVLVIFVRSEDDSAEEE